MVELEGNLVLHWIIVALGSLCPRKKPLITTTTIINNLIASQGAEKKHQLKGFLHDFLSPLLLPPLFSGVWFFPQRRCDLGLWSVMMLFLL